MGGCQVIHMSSFWNLQRHQSAGQRLQHAATSPGIPESVGEDDAAAVLNGRQPRLVPRDLRFDAPCLLAVARELGWTPFSRRKHIADVVRGGGIHDLPAGFDIPRAAPRRMRTATAGLVCTVPILAVDAMTRHSACGIVVGSNGVGQKFQGRQLLEVPWLTDGLQRLARQALAEEVQGIGVVPHGHCDKGVARP